MKIEFVLVYEGINKPTITITRSRNGFTSRFKTYFHTSNSSYQRLARVVTQQWQREECEIRPTLNLLGWRANYLGGTK